MGKCFTNLFLERLSYGVRHRQPLGKFRGLTANMQWLIAGAEMP